MFGETLTYVNFNGTSVGNLDEHMHLVAPVLVRLFKVELVDIRRHAIVTLTKLIPKVQVG
jgi:FKBP12-rapamycin complex-associated protein